MDSNLTISALSFKQQFSDLSGSLRRETSRGLNLAERMYIKHQPYTDSKTKRPGNQSVLIFEIDDVLADGSVATAVRATLKVQSLVDSNVVSSQILAVLERVINTVQEDDTGLDLGNEIFVNREQ